MNVKAQSGALVLVVAVAIIVFLIVKNPSFVAQKEKFIYGVNGGTATPEKLKELGVTMTRRDIRWDAVERQKGIYDFSSSDNMVNSLANYGITPLFIIDYGNLLYSPGYVNGEYTFNETSFQVFKQGYGEYCYQVINHYKGKVRYFEMWNEPNGKWATQTFNQAYQYVELMKECYTRGKQANPDAVIMSGGIGTWNDLIQNWIKNFYVYGGKDYFDILAVHPYCDYPTTYPLDQQGFNCSTLKNLAAIHQLMADYGDGDKKMWITEFGYPTEGCYIAGTTPTSGPVVTGCTQGLSYENQDIRMANLFKTLKEYPYVTAVFWYDFRDDCEIRTRNPIGCEPNVLSEGCPVWTECRFGLMNFTYGAKPAYYTYQQIIKGNYTFT